MMIKLDSGDYLPLDNIAYIDVFHGYERTAYLKYPVCTGVKRLYSVGLTPGDRDRIVEAMAVSKQKYLAQFGPDGRVTFTEVN